MKSKTSLLETFLNPNPERDYTIIHTAPEFTSVCPVTGQPDFATIILEYVPDKICVELKSYKFYLQSFRNEGIYFEAVTNKILNDLVKICKPRYMKITARFNTRGGISSEIIAEQRRKKLKKKFV
ncbi:MAG: NADPH-dependent 7-cyano-7-deazaguanine reductase QueF [Actinobacteria bacterium]|nr:NADPH-dependent 7-cyano-7-deazaguanine reductase QueF [Actinomycetota bacterium]